MRADSPFAGLQHEEERVKSRHNFVDWVSEDCTRAQSLISLKKVDELTRVSLWVVSRKRPITASRSTHLEIIQLVLVRAPHRVVEIVFGTDHS